MRCVLVGSVYNTNDHKYYIWCLEFPFQREIQDLVICTHEWGRLPFLSTLSRSPPPTRTLKQFSKRPETITGI